MTAMPLIIALRLGYDRLDLGLRVTGTGRNRYCISRLSEQQWYLSS